MVESDGGCATDDISEMLKSQLAGEINLLVYTGGTLSWANSEISNERNQIYIVKDGGLELIDDTIGAKYMTDPETLEYFLKYAKTNYQADRY